MLHRNNYNMHTRVRVKWSYFEHVITHDVNENSAPTFVCSSCRAARAHFCLRMRRLSARAQLLHSLHLKFKVRRLKQGVSTW